MCWCATMKMRIGEEDSMESDGNNILLEQVVMFNIMAMHFGYITLLFCNFTQYSPENARKLAHRYFVTCRGVGIRAYLYCILELTILWATSCIQIHPLGHQERHWHEELISIQICNSKLGWSICGKRSLQKGSRSQTSTQRLAHWHSYTKAAIQIQRAESGSSQEYIVDAKGYLIKVGKRIVCGKAIHQHLANYVQIIVKTLDLGFAGEYVIKSDVKNNLWAPK